MAAIAAVAIMAFRLMAVLNPMPALHQAKTLILHSGYSINPWAEAPLSGRSGEGYNYFDPDAPVITIYDR